MNRMPNRQRYIDRIARVTAYIDAHLDDPLDLTQLAGVACLSPFHFHRVYSAMTGETVGGTVRHRRLQRAATQLLGSSRPVAAIARVAGYGSAAAFARAFADAYGMPPATFRKRGVPSALIRSPTGMPTVTWTVTIETLPPRSVLAMRHTGPYEGLGAAFDRLLAWAGGRGLVTPGSRTFAVYLNDCFDLPAEQLRTEVCVDVSPPGGGGGDCRRIEISGGRHAVLHYQGPYTEMGAAYRWFYGEWLPRSGEELADRPAFDAYLNDPGTLPPEQWRTDLCLPLADR